MSALAALSAEELELAPAAPPPRDAGAMKAVLTDARFSDPAWIFERNLDGIRCISIRSGGELRLLSRSGPGTPYRCSSTSLTSSASTVTTCAASRYGHSHGRLRHPRFLGLRDDNAASEVVRER
jgi:ATP-dependent DNA ligase